MEENHRKISPVTGGSVRWEDQRTKCWIFQLAMFDCQRVTIIKPSNSSLVFH
jgi:hypothetical protein